MEITMDSVGIANGETLFYRMCGEGTRTVLFVHGNLVSSQCWEPFMRALPADFRSVAVDLRGAGQSSYNRPVESIRQFSRDLYFFCHEIALTRFVLVGLSMGGAVVQQFAADYPEMVDRLVLIDSVPSRGYPDPVRDEHFRPIAGHWRSRWEEVITDPVQILPQWNALKNGDRAAMKAIFDRAVFNVKQPDPGFYQAFIEQCFTIRNYPDCAWAIDIFNISHGFNGVVWGTGEVDRLTMPTLVMSGARDLVFNPASGRQTADDIGANAIFNEIPDAGHISFLDNLPEALEKFVDFVREIY